MILLINTFRVKERINDIVHGLIVVLLPVSCIHVQMFVVDLLSQKIFCVDDAGGLRLLLL